MPQLSSCPPIAHRRIVFHKRSTFCVEKRVHFKACRVRERYFGKQIVRILVIAQRAARVALTALIKPRIAEADGRETRSLP